ncbi:uncharacterized protein [Populus alba]|uniref:uncharacterized protein n=1 Tax=Populus alba TaxID=43335 RepID=UPI003CC741C3
MANDSNSNFIQPSIPCFDGHFDHWSMLMENFLRSKEFWTLLKHVIQSQRTILETILEKNTSKQIWDSMKRKYEGNARVKCSILQTLRKEFETLEMKTGENITEYFTKVMTVASKMRIYREQMRDVTIVEKILRSLTDRFKYIVYSIKESKDIDVLSIDELQSSLIVHEQKFQKHNMEEHALKVTSEDRFNGKGQGRRAPKGGGGVNKEANYAELNNEEEILSMSHVELYDNNREDAWFWTLAVQIICVETRLCSHMVTDVFYVPELKNNLLSIGQLQEKGLAILIKSRTCKIYHPVRGLIIQTRMTINKIYGHLNHKGLRTLQYKKMVRGLPQLPTSNTECTACIIGKQHRGSFPKKSQWCASQRLQLIHVDIYGPITPISNSKKRCPTFVVKDMTLEEVWIRVKPSVEHFRVFGCVAHMHIPNARRTKLENKSVMCIVGRSINASANTIHEEDVNLHARRETITPSWMRDYVSGEGLLKEETELNIVIVTSADPLSYEEAMKSYKWREAMDAEIESIQRNETWSLTELPAGTKKIGVKWIYKTKLNESEVFAPVARMETVRMIIALATQRSWLIYQLDVKSAFLHWELSEDLFVEQPKGYEQKGNEHKVYKLHKALCGLKQSLRAWFSRIEAYFTHKGFQKCISEQTLFVKQTSGGKILIVSVYVDDLISSLERMSK